MHNGFSIALSEGIVKLVTVVLSQVVTGERLTAVLVDTLENLLSRIISLMRGQSRGEFDFPRVTNLVTRGVTQTGEERGELATGGGIGVLLEDDFFKFGGGGDLKGSRISDGRAQVVL